MKKSWTLNALVVAASLAGCSTMNGSSGGGAVPARVQVTRTHLGQPIARAEIRVEPVAVGDPGFADLSGPIERELGRLGWDVQPSKASTEQVAVARLTQTPRANGGVGSELSVRIQRRSDATVFWEGRAQAETRANPDRAALAQRLASALFRDFPGESGRTITVR